MGEILLEALAEIVGAFIKFLFSPKVMESLPKPIRIFIRFMTILIVISLLGLILFAGFFALYSFIRKGASVLVLIGGIILLAAVTGAIAYMIHTLRAKF
ncbi:MAG: hypothetical protein J5783_02860 [Lachnospiraceae bacterium]|jgi:drug/metabolite transporter superfamily protein YnfA|nr:hypothetical protein [Lachnospiraceae bacterium]